MIELIGLFLCGVGAFCITMSALELVRAIYPMSDAENEPKSLQTDISRADYNTVIHTRNSVGGCHRG